MSDPEIERAEKRHAEAYWRVMQDRAVYGLAHVSKVNQRAWDDARRRLAWLRGPLREV